MATAPMERALRAEGLLRCHVVLNIECDKRGRRGWYDRV
jgi:hypothetical protein